MEYKEIVREIALAYYESYVNMSKLCDTLEPAGVYVNEIHNVYTPLAEKILDEVDEVFVEAILDICNGEEFVVIEDEHKLKHMTTIDEVINYFLDEIK